ncbi:MAG: hypothetical protein EOP61_34415 [Sphingomonadales bacterium]|nr:MAG: hypothetical protein EOP61_34415 [Sphingomonadales bacterium]
MPSFLRSLFLTALLGCAFATPAARAQDGRQQPAQGAPAATPQDGGIIVSGRLGEKSKLSPLPGSVNKVSRDVATDAHQFVRCLDGIPANLRRPIVEGHVRDPDTQEALDKLILTNTACYPRLFRPMLHMTSGYYGACNPAQAGIRSGQTNAEASAHELAASIQVDMSICRSTYDRGAIIEDTFLTQAPHFMLMRADTLDREVVDRFRARETQRGKHRSPMDRRYYDTVSCMVQLEPEASVRLIRAAPGSERETQLRMQILERTGLCTGNAKNVRVDPPQFRTYIADAVYHWALAAKNVETLIPAA